MQRRPWEEQRVPRLQPLSYMGNNDENMKSILGYDWNCLGQRQPKNKGEITKQDLEYPSKFETVRAENNQLKRDVLTCVEEQCNKIDNYLESVTADYHKYKRDMLKCVEVQINKIENYLEFERNNFVLHVEAIRREDKDEHKRDLSNMEEYINKIEKDFNVLFEKDLREVRGDVEKYKSDVLKIVEFESNMIVKHIEDVQRREKEEYKRDLLKLEERCNQMDIRNQEMEKRNQEMSSSIEQVDQRCKKLEVENKTMFGLLQEYKNYLESLEVQRNQNQDQVDNDDEDEDYYLINDEK